jgi:hypothetical protein
MMQNVQKQYTDSLTTYEIKVQGRLDHKWSSWFEDMQISVEEQDGKIVTTLYGGIPDQAALHGILSRIRDLGLNLILVRRKDAASHTK